MAVVGIDLGTTNTVVGVVRDGHATAVRDPDGEYLIPSVVSFHPSGTVLVGRSAKERRVVDATNTIYSIKRLIGRSWSSPEVETARTRFPFEMREGPGQAALVVARGESFTLPEISAFVLRHAKSLAEKALGENVDRAVITVPANFNDLQRAATKVAGRVAGLEVLRILNEPTAAALAYGYGRSKGERIVIYDFGGGTFDVTLLDLADNVFEVLATAGNTFLGGDDVDLAIAERMAEACRTQHGIDAHADVQVFERLRYYAERIKMDLSSSPDALVDVPDVARAGQKPVRLEFAMSREELDALAEPVVDKTFQVCREALGVARMTTKEFDHVVLVGGSTRLPIVRKKVAEFFGRPLLDRVNPDEVVAIGAAIQASALSGADRRRSSVPKPPMPAARALEESVATTFPAGTGQRPLGRPGKPPLPRSRAASRSAAPEARKRVTTGMGLGPAQSPPARPGSLPDQPPPPKKGGTLGGLGKAGPPLPERNTRSVFDADDEPTRVTASPSVAPRDPPPRNDQADEPTHTGISVELLRASRPPTDDESTLTDLEPPLQDIPALESSPRPGADRATQIGIGVPSRRPPDPMVQRSQPPFAAQAPSGLPPAQDRRGFSSLPPAAHRLSNSTAPASHPQLPLLIDVTPLTLCVETVGGFCDGILARNTPVPCEQSRPFVTAQDGQESVQIRVGQGESARFFENTTLGELELTGLRRAPRGAVTIQVTFSLDTNGMLQVRATDAESGKETAARIRLIGLPDNSEIEHMVERQRARQTL